MYKYKEQMPLLSYVVLCLKWFPITKNLFTSMHVQQSTVLLVAQSQYIIVYSNAIIHHFMK